MACSSEMGRSANVANNAWWAFVSQIVTVVAGFVSRKVFLSILGAELLGLNNLFSDVLKLFSFADLGVGTAISFALYKPIAEQNYIHIRSLLEFYRKVYRFVILVLIGISLVFFPFLSYLQTEVSLSDLQLYYIVYQAINILSYVCAYRESYVYAMQKAKILTIINTIFYIWILLTQIFVVTVFKSYIIYLVVELIGLIVRKLVTHIYLIKLYPESVTRGAEKLSKEEKRSICKKSYAVIVHRIGNLAINQTDSLIVSCMINVKTWGLVSNYLLIRNAVSSVMNQVYSAMLPSMGNLVAKESQEKQLDIFLFYDFINSWMYGFCFVGMSVLSTPFISLIFGNNVVMGHNFLFVFFLAFYIDGLRGPVSMLREARGAFEVDKWYTILAALINLIVSAILVVPFGIQGIYIGTIAASFVLHVSRTILLFKDTTFSYSYMRYFSVLVRHTTVAMLLYAVVRLICSSMEARFGITVASFLVECGIVAIVPNIIMIILNKKSIYFTMTIKFFRNLIHFKGRGNG